MTENDQVPKCRNHTNINALYFCEECGFMCNKAEETNKSHQVSAVDNDILALYKDILAEEESSEEIEYCEKIKEAIQSRLECEELQLCDQLKQAQEELKEELKNSPEYDNEDFLTAMRKSAKEAVTIDMDEEYKRIEDMISEMFNNLEEEESAEEESISTFNSNGSLTTDFSLNNSNDRKKEEEGKANDQDDGTKSFNDGTDLLKQGKYTEGIEILQKTVDRTIKLSINKKNSKIPNALYNIGYAYYMIRDITKAIDYMRQAGQAYFNIFDAKSFKEMEISFNKAIEYSKGSPSLDILLLKKEYLQCLRQAYGDTNENYLKMKSEVSNMESNKTI